MLYALWCLQDLERVDDLEARMRIVKQAGMLPLTDGGVRNLNEELAAVQREIRQPVGRFAPGMSREELLSFPGMPNYKKGPVS